MMIKHVLIGYLALLVCSAHAEKSTVQTPRENHAAEVRNNLARCPSWEFLDSDDDDLRRGITHLYLKISRFDTESVREGVRLYLDNYSSDLFASLDASGKLYAFYRVFFRVPSGFYATSSAQMPYPVEIQSFWGSPHRGSHEVDLLWPYSISKDGTLELQNVLSVQERTGPGYSPLSDFDVLLLKFGRRFPVQKK